MQAQGKISFGAAILLSINIMVGAGILYAVGPMTAALGSVSFLGWPLVGLLLFPVIWTIAKAAQIFPGEGGFYHYCSSGINPQAGFIAHWGYLMGYLATAAGIATALREGFINNGGLEFFRQYPIAFNLILAVAYSLINLIAVGKISKIQSVGTLLKITPIITVIALLAFYLKPSLGVNLAELSGIGSTVSTVIFAFWGFEACCSIGGLLKDGPQKVGTVILVGFFATISLYFFFHLGLLYIMGTENLATYGAIAFPRFLGLPETLGTALQVGITGAVLLSWANSILGISLGNINNIYSLAQNKLILGNKLLTTVNRNNRPVYAILVHGIALFAFITFITDINILFALTNFGVITAFELTLLAVFLAHWKSKNYVQMGITILAFISCTSLIYYSWIKIPSVLYVLPLIVCMILGIIMFKIQKHRAEQAVSV